MHTARVAVWGGDKQEPSFAKARTLRVRRSSMGRTADPRGSQTQRLARRRRSLLFLALRSVDVAGTSAACGGASQSLDSADCAAWVDIYDATKGSQWADCSGNRLDPCGCTAKDRVGWGAVRVACTSDKTHITKL
jgi:hypothetical protein